MWFLLDFCNVLLLLLWRRKRTPQPPAGEDNGSVPGTTDGAAVVNVNQWKRSITPKPHMYRVVLKTKVIIDNKDKGNNRKKP